jgi:hypothetical protein
MYLYMEINTMSVLAHSLFTTSTSNDATGGQLATVTAQGNAQACIQASNQPRKRGRPWKDASLSANNPPKKRGRPPKNRSASGNPQSAGNTLGSLALVLVQDDLPGNGTVPLFVIH